MGGGSNTKVLSLKGKEGGISGFKEVGDGGAIGSAGSSSSSKNLFHALSSCQQN